MKIMKKFTTVLALIMGVFFSSQAFAMVEDAPQLLKKIEAKLAEIKTMDTKLTQTSSGQQKATGSLILSRPGKMLLTYDAPVTTSVIADGYNVIFYDTALEQVTYLGLDETPAFFILKEGFSFNDKKIKVLDVGRKKGKIEVTMTQKKNPLAGKITLVFKEKPLQLLSWTITDARRTKTTVTLKNTKYNVPVDEEKFVFINPNRTKKRF